MHLTYSIYHLSRPAKARTPTSSGSYMIFAAILDSCIVPFLVLIAILAHNQLIGALDDDTAPWVVNLGTGNIIILSTYLIGIATAGLHFVSLCISLFLAMRFRKISQLPPDMNPLEDNLTRRGHNKAKASVSTFMTETTQNSGSPLMQTQTRMVPHIHTRNDSGTVIYTPDKSRLPADHIVYQDRSNASSRTDLRQSQQSPRRAKAAAYSSLAEDSENWGTHGPTPPGSPPGGPAEFQHLRVSRNADAALQPAPFVTQPKYDFTNRSPRPLGLHPPTPRESTPKTGQSFDTRVLRNIDGNSSAPRASTASAVWDDIKHELDAMGSSSPGRSRKQYGEVVSMGNVSRNQARVVSSGIDDHVVSHGMRMRDVSGKIAKEGRGGVAYREY